MARVNITVFTADHCKITKEVKNTSLQRWHPISFEKMGLPIRRFVDVRQSLEFEPVPTPSMRGVEISQLPDSPHENCLP